MFKIFPTPNGFLAYMDLAFAGVAGLEEVEDMEAAVVGAAVALTGNQYLQAVYAGIKNDGVTYMFDVTSSAVPASR